MNGQWSSFLAKVVGIAAKDLVGGLLRGVGVGIGTDIAAIIVGYLISRHTTGLWRDFGEGLMLGGAAQIARPYISRLTGAITGAAAPSPATTAPAPTPSGAEALAMAYASR